MKLYKHNPKTYPRAVCAPIAPTALNIVPRVFCTPNVSFSVCAENKQRFFCTPSIPRALLCRFIATALVPLLLCASFASCKKEPVPPRTEFVLGTVCTIDLRGKGSDAFYGALFDRLRRIEADFSANLPDSQIARVNANAGKTAVPVSDEVFDLIKTACVYAQKSDGAFDPAIGALVKLWNIGSDDARVPAAAEIERVLPLLDYTKVRLNESDRTVYLEEECMQLDLGAIAKGYAADELAAMIRARGIDSAIIDLGGNVYVVGEKEPQTPWTVGIRNPFSKTAQSALGIRIKSTSVVTSGTYERFFEQDGVRYHHLLDKTSGYPAQNEVASFTIITPHSVYADALSTAAFVLGREKGMALIENEPNTEAICITKDGMVYATSGIADAVLVLDDAFTLVSP